MTLSAVLFDMDGLLVDTEPMWLEAEHQTLATLGGTWSEEHQRAIMGASMAHATAYMCGISGTERTDAEVAELLISSMLVRLTGAEIPIQPGAAELLADVAASGIPFGLVSASVRPIVDLVLESMGRSGLPVFPVSVAGDEVARSKPDPMPYLHAADLLGVDITRAVVLEDSPNGVRAAWTAGATVVAVPHAVPVEAGERIVVRESLVGLDVAGLASLVG
jgi:beta-phosphoglucomutase-like phosphatase (HAD superfamily)